MDTGSPADFPFVLGPAHQQGATDHVVAATETAGSVHLPADGAITPMKQRLAFTHGWFYDAYDTVDYWLDVWSLSWSFHHKTSNLTRMSKLDVAKEQIAYLKFWLGVLVVTDISLVGWLVSREDPNPVYKILGAVIAIAVVTFAGFMIHRQIERRIDALEEL